MEDINIEDFKVHDNSMPAFPLYTPQWHQELNEDFHNCDLTTGISQRQYFAAKAMQALIAIVPHDEFGMLNGRKIARSAFDLADYMLEEDRK